ncbi:MAG: hypothetical protein JWN72_2501 [Thermoleophilia bacterium]|nr:hypothetical protein [Thermoleophilia bacterium]
MHALLTRLHPLERGIGLAIGAVGVVVMLVTPGLGQLFGGVVLLVGGLKFVAGPMHGPARATQLLAAANLRPGSSGGFGVDPMNCAVGGLLIGLAGLPLLLASSGGVAHGMGWMLLVSCGIILLFSWVGHLDDRRRQRRS